MLASNMAIPNLNLLVTQPRAASTMPVRSIIFCIAFPIARPGDCKTYGQTFSSAAENVSVSRRTEMRSVEVSFFI